MQNHIALIQGDDHLRRRHGGPQLARSFHLYINGHLYAAYHEDTAATGYCSGEYFDRFLNETVELLESCLHCKCVRGRFRNRKELVSVR